jgi:hypothetical protein
MCSRSCPQLLQVAARLQQAALGLADDLAVGAIEPKFTFSWMEWAIPRQED